MKNTRARSIADVTAGKIIATVDIASPPARVFQAIASKEIANWWAVEGAYRTTEWTGDVRVGGRFRSSGVGADGHAFAVEGEFLEIDSPSRLTHTWEPGWAPGEKTRVTWLLTAIDGGTRVTLRHEGFTSPESCQSHGDGWEPVLNALAPHVAPATPKQTFFIKLLPPRPTFMHDMNDEERKMMMEHAGYWTAKLHEGAAVAFGPTSEGWGLGLVQVDDASLLKTFEADDPAIKSGLGFRYDVLPLVRAVTR